MSDVAEPVGRCDRLVALAGLAILDTAPEPEFDEVVETLRAICRTPVALVSLVDEARQWFKARAGTDLTETPVDTSVCALVVQRADTVVIPDLAADPRTAGFSLVREPPHLRFYAGAPIVTGAGHVLGSLCAIDTRARPEGVTPEQAVALRALADQVALQIELRAAEDGPERAILDERSRQARALADSAVLSTIAAVQRHLLAGGGGPEELLQAVVEGALAAIGPAEGTAVVLAEAGELVYRNGAGLAVAEPGQRVAIDRSVSGRCFRERRALFIRDSFELEASEAGRLQQRGIRSVLCVPLAQHGEPIGLLSIFARDADAFRSRHVLIARVLGEMVARGLVEIAESEAKRAAAAVEQRYRHIVDSAIDSAIIATDAVGRVTSWSRGSERIMGWSEDEVIGRPLDLIFTPEDREIGRPQHELRTAAETGRASDKRWHLRRDGSRFFAHGAVTPLVEEPGGGFVKSMRDVTDEHATRKSLAESRERLELTARAARLGSFDYLPETDQLDWDDRCRELFGLGPGAPVSYAGSFVAGVHPDDRAHTLAAVESCLDPRGTHRYETEYRTIGIEDGIVRHVAASGLAIFEGDVPVRFIGTVQDVSENRRAAAAVHEAEERLRLAAAATNDAIWDWELGPDRVVWNEALFDAFGHPPEAIAPVSRWRMEHVHPDDRDRIFASLHAVIDGDGRVWADEYRFRRADGSYAEVLDRGHVVRDARGTATRMIGAMLDQSERKRAQRALERVNETLEVEIARATAEVLAREEQLRQAQKMEAVGQLTGGIAHDFNNMLTGIIGSLDLLKRQVAAGRTDRIDRYIDAATTSAQRAAGLTHRLLAFSRRQSLDVKPIDVVRLVSGLEDILRRTLGEGVGLEVHVPDGLWPAVTDANQLESALLNLAINARDAMPGGGKLTIEASNATLDETYTATVPDLAPGDFALICVSDTGCGMSGDVIEKAFDPFFTTKPQGQGTGLGLSMIYGFARQSGGHVRIYSEPGKGTTIKLYLPRHVGEVAAEPTAAAGRLHHADEGECVLVVEDDAAVRMLVVEVLETLGYGVITAEDGRAAVAILESGRRIDLLVSDVGLPGLNGRQVAEIARRTRPGLKVLFVTGYAEGAAVRGGFLDEGMEMIMKPFAIDALAARIRAMIEG